MAKRGTLEIKILGDERPLAKSMDKAGGILKSFAGGAVGIFAGLGVAGGAALAASFGEALSRDRLNDKLAAQLGATPAEAERFGRIAGNLWADAYGDSIEQVNDAIGAVVSSISDDLDDDTLQELTAHALNFAATFETDVTQAVTSAGILLNTKLARDGEDAFDLLVDAAQRLPAEMRDEIFPLVEEYSQFLSGMGFTGEEAFEMMLRASQEGRFEMDKAFDAVKEFTVQATDMAPDVVKAYEDLGLSAEDMASKIASGGPVAREAMDTIIDALLDVEDPANKANLAIALFGTPIEDLSVAQIPDFLEALDQMGGSLDTVSGKNVPDVIQQFEGFQETVDGDVIGAAERLDKTLNDNVATRFTELKRTIQQEFIDFAHDHLLPRAEEIMDAFEEDGVGGAIGKAIELWEEAQPQIQAWWTGTFMPFWRDTAQPMMAEVGEALAASFIDGFGSLFSNWIGEQFEIDPTGFYAETFPNLRDFFDPVGARRRSGVSSPGPGGSLSSFTAFHGGGETTSDGIAMLAKKERVLSPSQTDAFNRLVDHLTSGGTGQQAVGAVYLDGKRVGDAVIDHIARHTRRGGTLVATTVRQ